MNEATSTKKTVTESMELLTGFDEIAIEKSFGADIDSLRVTMTLRSLVFIDKRREGLDVKAAYNAAMELTTKQVNEHFAEDDDDDDGADELAQELGEDPVTESGKDATLDD